MKEKDLKKIWLIGIFIIIVLFVVYLINERNEEKNITSSTETYSIVSNYNDFYTVNSCIYRYLTYLQNKNTDSLLKVLDQDFKNSNNITENNLYNYLLSYDGNITFNSRKMFEEKISSNVTKYYVYGYVEKDIMDSFPEQYESYFIVKLDHKNSIFTIMPYSGDVFK